MSIYRRAVLGPAVPRYPFGVRLSASVRLRPTRIGFLVEPADLESVRQIFQVCTCLWGGAFNPIIPVCDELPEAWQHHEVVDPTPAQLAKGYIDFFEPDVFVEARPGLAARAGVQDLQLDFVHSRTAQLDGYFQDRPNIPFGLDCSDIYQAVWNREFRFQASRERRVGVFARDGADAAFTEMAFGGFPESGPLARFAGVFRNRFAGAELSGTAEAWGKAVGELFVMPIDFTRETLETAFHADNGRIVAFIADPASPLDLIDCWNLRQVRRNVLPINLNWLRAAQPALSKVVPALTERTQGLPLLEVQFGRSVLGPHERADYAVGHQRMREAGFELDCAFGAYPRFWGARRDPWDRMAPPRPRRASISAGETSADPEVSDDQLCQLPALAPSFVDEFGSAAAARWANVLTFSPPWGDAETLALVIPSSLDVTKPRRFGFAGDPRLASREGLVLPKNYKHDRTLIRMMTGPEALRAWLNDQGVAVTRSDAGRAADQVLERFGGTWGTFIIQDEETVKFLNQVAQSGTKSAHHLEWARVLKKRAEKSKAQPAVVPKLADLVDRGAARLGLKIACPKCSEPNWYAATELRGVLACEGCLAHFKFPEGTLDLCKSPWHYRVVGPFSKLDYAGGAYAVALAISLFARRLDTLGTDVTYAAGLGLTLRNAHAAKRQAECDFALWYRPREVAPQPDAEPTLIFGEAKSFGRDTFQPKDVARLWRLWMRFPCAFMAFATLRGTLEDAEVRRIRRFASAARAAAKLSVAPIIILTGTELFAAYSVEASWKESGGERAALLASQRRGLADPWRLAELTQRVYLGVPGSEAARPGTAGG
jgi:hypothetical protein